MDFRKHFIQLAEESNIREVVVKSSITEDFDGKYYLKQLKAGEGLEYQQSLITVNDDGTIKPNAKDAVFKLLVITLCNEDGELVCKKTDIGTLKNLPTTLITELYISSATFSGISASDEENEKN